MKFHTLDDWLDYQSQQHNKTIDLGLERVAQVWQMLGAPQIAETVISVAGTNGKGSSVALLEAIVQEAGYRSGCFTSPHLIRYNERIRLDKHDVDDQTLINAFEQIEQARADIPLTYFEYGTLAALLIFSQSNLEVAILEVGLGGRLDAVNIIDTDTALITSIALDHTDWLGDSIEKIGYEKAGIARKDKPLVFASADMPQSIEQHAVDIGAQLQVYQQDYQIEKQDVAWHWRGKHAARLGLPIPAMRGEHQLRNAAGVIAVLQSLADKLVINQAAIKAGLISAKVMGRFDTHQHICPWVFDVAHNPQAVAQLSAQLGERYVQGQRYAIVGMLKDKAIADALAQIKSRFDHWFCLDLSDQPRGASSEQLKRALSTLGVNEQSISEIDQIGKVFEQLSKKLVSEDQVVVFGSFITVGEGLSFLQHNNRSI